MRDSVSPAFLPPNQEGLVTVKTVPLPLTSASQNSRLSTGESEVGKVSRTMMNLLIVEVTGMFRV